MATCCLQHSISTIGKSNISRRKRFLSETNELNHSMSILEYDSNNNIETRKRSKIEINGYESGDKYQQEQTQILFGCTFENTRFFHSPPGLLRSSSTYINSRSTTTQTHSNFQPALSATKEKTNMLALQTTSEIIPCPENNVDSRIFLSTVELAFLIANNNNIHLNPLIIDCGSTFRYSERRIHNSLLLDVNDKISRKRLSTRGLKIFLDANQLNRVDQHQVIVLYDDAKILRTSCSTSLVTPQLSQPMKCVYDELKRYNNEKKIYVLQSPFDEFYQNHSDLCYTETPQEEDKDEESSIVDQTMDIDMYEMSQILPGLYLGNARDAEDFNLLEENQIRTVINISNSIPCFFENQSNIDYLRLPCDDTHSQNIIQHFENAFQWMNEKLSRNQSILVHCQGGVSRSPSFVIGYLMKYHSKTFDQAYQLVKTKRTIINPNFNFLGQLSEYQRMLNRV